jgi:tRNA-specific 2-thiouridylase
MNTRRRIVVAMSGGVDSSVAAALLASEGHEVIGITIKTYAYEDVGGNDGNESSCCSLDGINDARAVAAQFNFPHYVLDFSEPFNSAVIEDFVAEYMRGRTPNPCVVCNRKIKWEELIRKALALGADAIATGHYARVRRLPNTGRFVVSRGRDGSKDQSYALWGLTQESLSRTIFPLAEHTKPEVRALAEKLGLTIAGKGESFEICFIPDNNYERFLKERIPGLENKVAGGEIIQDGRVVGRHRGFPFYTIGQRRGIGVATGAPIYVTGIDPGNNRVTIGPDKALFHAGLIARNVNMMKYERCPPGLRVNVRIRYKDGGGLASAEQLPDGRVKIIFDEPRRAITPGQSAVLYEGDDLVGGGVIDDVLEDVPELA